MGSDRICSVDIAKGIAIISIIIGHLGIDAINRVVYTYHIPVFLLISGYFIDDRKSIKRFAIDKFKSLMVPYVITCMLMILLGTIRGDYSAFLYRNSGNGYWHPFMVRVIHIIVHLSYIKSVQYGTCLQRGLVV